MRKMLILGLTVALVLASGVLIPVANGQNSNYSVALIIAQGGLGDRSYNDSAFAGLTRSSPFPKKPKKISSMLILISKRLLRVKVWPN